MTRPGATVDHPNAFSCPSVARDGVLGPCEEVLLPAVRLPAELRD
ncbi:hypothetical protein [Streptomyces coffeae]|nr:hypothetical protein [Streptomyces coffeae]